MLKRILGLFAGLLLVTACSAAETAAPTPATWVEGQHYFLIEGAKPATPGKVDVTEVFSYACPHCAHFQPFADQLKAKLPKQATFNYLPAIFHESWEPYARAFYTAQSLNALDRTHQALFDALHRDHKQLTNIQQLSDFYAELGVDQKTFLGTAQSFVVTGKLQESLDKVRAWGIDGTPSIVVNGKYRITGTSAGSLDKMIDLTLWLVQKELSAAK